MKTALFVILITESVLKEISSMGILSNETETIPEDIIASEMTSTYAAEITINATNNSDNSHGHLTYATEKISNATSVSDGNRLSTGGNLKPFIKIPIETKIGDTRAPKKLRKGWLEMKIRNSIKATKKNEQVMIARNNKKDTEFTQVSIDSVHQESAHPKKSLTKLTNNITKPEKATLRYGFQQTKLCPDYEKAFMCMRSCLDMGYDIAQTNRKCVCQCKRNRMLHNHKQLIKVHSSTPWKGGAPTTSLPPWVIKQSSAVPMPGKNPENNDYEVYADVSFSNKPGEGEGLGGGGDAGEAENATEGSGDAAEDGEGATPPQAGDGSGDGEAKGDEDGNTTPAEGDAAAEEGAGGEAAGEGTEGGEAAPAEEGEAEPAEEGQAPAEEAPAEER